MTQDDLYLAKVAILNSKTRPENVLIKAFHKPRPLSPMTKFGT